MPDVIYDVIILGAGASGLFCARAAAARGRSVLLLDHAARPGIKLSITGGGKCNLTNKNIRVTDYTGENPDFCRSALARLTPESLMALARDAGIALEEREHGQMFCRRSAGDLLRLLLQETGTCRLALGERVLAAEKARGIFTVHTRPGDSSAGRRLSAEARRESGASQRQAPPLPPSAKPRQPRGSGPAAFPASAGPGGVYQGRVLVVALGGPAWPQIGATGAGYELARAFGHTIAPIRPALVGLTLPEGSPLRGLDGVSAPVSLRFSSPRPERGDEAAARPDQTNRGAGKQAGKRSSQRNRAPVPLLPAPDLPLLFTHFGISGPAALQASLFWRPGQELLADFLPRQPLTELLETPGAGRLLCRNLLRGHLPERLAAALLPPELAAVKAAELSRAGRKTLADSLHAFAFTPAGTEGFRRAEVAAGGVRTDELFSRSLESRLVPGLYFCGEVLDVTGRLGGYNLHWAFASGLAVGEHA